MQECFAIKYMYIVNCRNMTSKFNYNKTGIEKSKIKEIGGRIKNKRIPVILELNTQSQCKSKEKQEDERFIKVPKATVARFHWRYKSWAAYELPNGEKIMSIRQIALLCGQPTRVVQDFVNINNLQTLNVQIPNKKVIQGYSLTTVALLLKLLLKKNELYKHKRIELKNEDWEDLIENLLNPQRKIKPLNLRLRDVETCVAEIKIAENQDLEILYTATDEYYIDFQSGLKAVHIDVNWLTSISKRKVKLFSNLNISEVFQCKVENTTKFTFCYGDWLSIWKHFASNGNKYAIALLVSLAEENIPTRVKKSLKTQKNEEIS